MGRVKEEPRELRRNLSKDGSTSSSEDNKLAEMRMKENLDQFDAYIR